MELIRKQGENINNKANESYLKKTLLNIRYTFFTTYHFACIKIIPMFTTTVVWKYFKNIWKHRSVPAFHTCFTGTTPAPCWTSIVHNKKLNDDIHVPGYNSHPWIIDKRTQLITIICELNNHQFQIFIPVLLKQPPILVEHEMFTIRNWTMISIYLDVPVIHE